MNSPSGEPTLPSLLDAARSGDAGAWRRLVRSQADRLYGIAWRVSGDRGLAEDAVQQTFLRLLDGRSPPRSAEALPAWLARVTTRFSIDAVRSRSSRRQRERERAMDPVESRGEASSPEEAAMTREQEALVASALELLPTDMRASLWLQVVEGIGVREIAETLGSSRSSVSRLVRDGMARVKSFLERHGAVALLPGVRGLLRQLPNPAAPESLVAALEEIPASAAPGPEGKLEAVAAGVASGGLLARALVSASAALSIVGVATYLAFRSADTDSAPGLDRGPVPVAADPSAPRGARVGELPGSGEALPGPANSRAASPGAGAVSPRGGTYQTSVSGVAMSTADEPVPAARVDLVPTGWAPEFDFASEPAQTVRTDGLGRFQFDAVDAGSYRLRVRSRLGLGMLWPIDIRRGDAPAADLRIEVHRLERCMGRIVLPEGRPLPEDVEVLFATVKNVREGEQPVFDMQRAQVAPDGRMLLELLEGGPISHEQIVAFVKDHFVSRIETGGFPDRPLEIHFESGRRASSRIVDREGEPVPNLTVVAYSRRQRELPLDLVMLTHVEEVTTDADGRFSLTSLPPGEITLKAASGPYLSRDLVTFESAEQGVPLEPIRVPASHPIRGRLQDGDPPTFAGHVYFASIATLKSI